MSYHNFKHRYDDEEINGGQLTMTSHSAPDKFSHRTYTSESATMMQYYKKLEDLVRKCDEENKLINTYRFIVRPKKDTSFDEAYAIVEKIIADLGIEDIIYDKENANMSAIIGIKDDLVLYGVFEPISNQDIIELAGIALRLSCVGDQSKTIIDEFEKNDFEAVMDLYGANIKGASIKFAFPGPNGPRIQPTSFDKIPFETIKDNYIPEIQEHYAEMLSTIETSNSGLVLLHGSPGTGKSYLLRAMLSDIQGRTGIICSPPLSFLTDLGQIGQVLSTERKSIIILEDVGDILLEDGPSQYANITANLLNITEGLFSFMSDVVFVLTFNYEINKINPALQRPGRCLGRFEINALPHDHAQRLVGFNIPMGDYTLAEVYQMRKNGPDSKKRVKPAKKGGSILIPR